jgi:hypothetical protein
MDRQTLRDWVIRFNEQGPDMEALVGNTIERATPTKAIAATTRRPITSSGSSLQVRGGG